MKAKLIFNLPEENEEFELATNAINYSIVLSELDNYLRSKIKYLDLTPELHDVYQEIRAKLHDLAIDNRVEL